MTAYEEYLHLHSQCEYDASAADQREWQSWSPTHKSGSIGTMKLRVASMAAEKEEQAALREAAKRSQAALLESNYGVAW